MIFNPPIKGDDGLYFVKAHKDDKRKCLIQLNGVSITDVSGEITFDLMSESNSTVIEDIDARNLDSANENCEAWFGKKLTKQVTKGAYTPSSLNNQMTCDRLDTMKVFNAQRECIDADSLQVGKMCNVLLEFSGLWFAKKAFGSAWNVVQVKIHDEIHPEDTYPDEYAFVDDEEQA
jgi:hypothetical protein